MKKIVILDAYITNPGELSWESIKVLGSVDIYDRTCSEDIVSRSAEAEIIVTNKCLITKEIMAALPSLKCICLLATGYNNVDIEAAKSQGVVVCNAVGYSTTSVAQHVFALILSMTNYVAIHNQSVHKCQWADSVDWSYRLGTLQDLQGKTLGIYGFGTIGQKVADIGLAFGMKIIATKRKMAEFTYPNVVLVSEDELLSHSDILSLNASLSDANKHFINESSLSKMKSDSLLINTARGPLINEEDLAQALKSGTIGGAALDVLSDEPPQSNNPLFNIPNCVITPHISWASLQSRQRLIKIVAQNIESYIKGSPINTIT
jgi:glycerate dehydrogenase